MARLFVAIDFSEDVLAVLKQCQPRARPGVRCTSHDQLHVTLHFLGERNTEPIVAALRSLQVPPFRLTIQGTGLFPGKSGGAILWAGIQMSPELDQLHQAVSAVLHSEGYQPEARPFRPHITLARCEPNAPPDVAEKFLSEHAGLRLPAFRVDQVKLYSSLLTKHGPEYHCELIVPLC